MDTENPFSFFAEDNKTHFEIVIPGHPTNRTWKVRWDKSMERDFKVITKPERIEVVRYYQEHGFLTGYDEKTLEDMRAGNRGWVIAHPWNIRSDNPAYVRIFEETAHRELKERLWRPMFYTLSEITKKGSYTDYQVPVLPKIVTMAFVDKWYRSNQDEAAYLDRIQKKSEQTRISLQHEDGNIVLKIKDHPFVNQPVERVLLYPHYPKNFAKRMTDEDQDFLRLKLLRRDAYRLKGLSDNERTRLAHFQPVDINNDYRIHWIKWLSFHGDMSLQNAILVTRDIDIKYRSLVQKPFDAYWEKNWNRLAQSGQRIYVDIPVPMTGYRPTPIRPVRTKRQNRYHLNRMAQEALADYQHED